jgi:NRAMP (natural resistance-associated macrophage protein)-like metal ion transporter
LRVASRASAKVFVQKTSPEEVPEKGFLESLGPGLITGAADDDPSGIATYSQVGAQFGLSLLWTMIFTFPLMAAIQEICGRLGRITGTGVATSLRKRYSRPFVFAVVFLLCVANIFNLGADLAAMGDAAATVVGGKALVYAVLFGAVSLLLQIMVPYRIYVRYLRWLTLALFAYVAAVFVVHVPWLAALRAAVWPHFQRSSEYWMALVAVLGTTLSPYLFFWQTAQEAEEVRLSASEQPLRRKPRQAGGAFRRIAMDTRTGMAFSNLVAIAIILTTAVTLHAAGSGTGAGASSGSTTIRTAADAAVALKPVAGKFAFLLFALGIVGTGMLAIPVLAGSAGYAVAGVFGWKGSLEKKPEKAPKFYAVIAVATVVGIALDFVGLNPIQALYWSAVLNGLVAAPVMYAVMRLADDPEIVGEFRLPGYLRWGGWIATAVMLLASLAFLASSIFAKK